MRAPFIFKAAAVAGLLACTAFAAQARTNFSVGVNIGLPVYGGYHNGGYYGRGYYGSGYYGGGYYGRGYRSYGSSLVFVAPPVVFGGGPDTIDGPVIVQQQQAAALPTAPSRPDPVIYPRNGQSAQQTEGDRQECNRWATTQPAALADAGVFHRAVEACMDGRGYTLK